MSTADPQAPINDPGGAEEPTLPSSKSGLPSSESGLDPSEPRASSASTGLGGEGASSGDMAWGDAPRIVLSGACIGTADLVPGVSGGTMAVALGIYREFLAAITSVNLPALKALLRVQLKTLFSVVHWRFIACLGVGIVIAFVVMGKIVKLPEMVSTSPKPVYAVFFGLVLASVYLLVKRVGSWSPAALASLPLGALLGFVVVTLVPVQTPENPAFVFFAGMIAISAMILPGISGSFMLLVMGKYEYIMTSLLSLDLTVAVPFAAGCAVGIALFSRVLGYLLDRFHDAMVAGLTGLLLGSLIRIWPYQHTEKAMIRGKERIVSAEAFWPETLDWWIVLLALAGVAAVLAVEFLAARRTTKAAI